MNIDKITLLVLLAIVGLGGASLGYALRPVPIEPQISYEQSQEACTRAMHMMEGLNRSKIISTNIKTKKQIAIDRMMSN